MIIIGTEVLFNFIKPKKGIQEIWDSLFLCIQEAMIHSQRFLKGGFTSGF